MVLLSIIIPTLNEESTIQACLKPLQLLRNQGVEVIVVDGGSTDGSRELAVPYANKIILSEPGRARQMNRGASAACGLHLLFLHADTILPEEFLVSTLVGKTWGFFLVRLSGLAWQFRCIERAMNLRSKITSIATGDQAMFVSADLFYSLKGFANIPLMEDIEFCARLKAVSKPTLGAGVVTTSSRRWEQRGIIRTVFQMWRLRIAFFFGVSPHLLARQYYP